MTSQQTCQLLLAMALILLLAAAFGRAARRFGQPAVVGEIVLGVLLGPTLSPGLSARVIPAGIRPQLGALADVGVALFMFLVGLGADHGFLRTRGRRAAGAALGATVLPFVLGCLLALGLGHTGQAAPSRLGSVLFFGIAMSMTAFPVLARILAEDGLRDTEIAGIALAAAAIGDVVVWSLLAFVLAFTADRNAWHLLAAIPYAAALVFCVRPLLARLARRASRDGAAVGAVAAAVALALASGSVTEWLGLHFIFGAFLAGALFPRSGTAALRRQIVRGAEAAGSTLLMPVYFVIAGLNVDLGTVGWRGVGTLGLILVTAVGGKLLGGYLGARAARLPVRQSAALGVLMNTRGLTELIILGIGLQLRYLDGRLYSLMVVMAVVTTAMTGPLLQAVYPAGTRTPRSETDLCVDENSLSRSTGAGAQLNSAV